ncbi:hypothetical protein FEMY_21620 [Ferrovum myxofaciens]|jgi:hypothetical protein|uniref:Uncharacterized protein n=1 Tax=Ferrovum myxofaciens TaxID=416213 RepID=A0A149VVS0_9PROT|nr:hypothetical protein FEMY_21620 [Ferrovum myxofaciens]
MGFLCAWMRQVVASKIGFLEGTVTVYVHRDQNTE